MIYLTGSDVAIARNPPHPQIGFMAQPKSAGPATISKWRTWAADNGCFTAAWREPVWLAWLDRVAVYQEACLFAAAPDVPFDHQATLRRWPLYVDAIWDRGLKAAFVAQNGCTPDDIPDDAEAVFIGGDTDWKLSEVAHAVMCCARAHGRWVHVGRVNSEERIKQVALSADSCDGTYLKFGPRKNMPNLLRWLENLGTQPVLPMFGGDE